MYLRNRFASLLLTVALLNSPLAGAADANATGDPLGEFERFAEQPPPRVPAHRDALTFYPCSQCHDHWQTDKTPRLLAPVHDVGLDHGKGRLWCFECHSADDRNALQTLRGSKVDIDETWKICGQCHANRQQDWYFGAHGKRADGTWQGDRERYDCTHCHNPHQPPFMQRKPSPPPPVRAGLTPMVQHTPDRQPIWARHASRASQGERHE